jgi:hypothetical protein
VEEYVTIVRLGAIQPERGVTGLRHSGGRIREEFLPTLQGSRGMRIYREMRDNDAVIGASLLAFSSVVKQASWKVEASSQSPGPAELAARDFVRDSLESMAGTWSEFLSEELTKLAFGWAFFEIVYERRLDGRIGWRKWAIRAQDSLDHWELDEHGGVQGMWQRDPNGGGALVFLPIGRALLFRVGSHLGSPEGRSLLRNAYRSWYFLKRLQEIEAIGIERDLAGLPIAEVPVEMLSAGATAEQQAVVNDIKAIVTQVRRDEREGVVMPSSTDANGQPTGYSLRLLSTGGSRAINVGDAIRRYQQDIALSMLTQFLMLGMEKVGSFALAAGHETVFGAAVDSVMDETTDVINRYAIPPLMRLNGFPPPYPRMVHGQVDTPELAQLGSYLQTLASNGLLTSDAALEARLREFAALPPREEGARPAPAAAIAPDVQTPDVQTPDVQTPAETAEAAETAAVQAVALNGAQVEAALGIVARVATRQLPRDAGVAALVSLFGLSTEQAETIMGEVGRTFFAPVQP